LRARKLIILLLLISAVFTACGKKENIAINVYEADNNEIGELAGSITWSEEETLVNLTNILNELFDNPDTGENVEVEEYEYILEFLNKNLDGTKYSADYISVWFRDDMAFCYSESFEGNVLGPAVMSIPKSELVDLLKIS